MMRKLLQLLFGRKKPQPVIVKGYNTRGNVTAKAQAAMVGELLAPGQLVRVNGGTASQEAVWTEAMVDAWATAIKGAGLRVTWTANINRPVTETMQTVRWFLNRGVKFELIEIGNETYLPKYAKGEGKGVERVITPADYFDRILPEFVDALTGHAIGVVAAPAKTAGHERWNKYVRNTLVKGIGNVACLHLYADADNLASYDYAQIDRLKSYLPAHTRLYVSECGALRTAGDRLGATAPKDQVQHLKNIMARLKDRDMIAAHTLWGRPELVPLACMDENGWTEMGMAVQRVLK